MLVHYVIVRRDLPLGTMAAMIVHAAGESAAWYKDSFGAGFPGAIAVVLEAKNEQMLYRYGEWLKGEEILYTPVYETAEPYTGELMAIGVVPCDRDRLSPKMRDLQTLKSCLPAPSDEVENNG